MVLHKALNATCLVRQIKHGRALQRVLSRCQQGLLHHLEQHSCLSPAETRAQTVILGSILQDIALQCVNTPVVKYQSEALPHVLSELWV